LTAQPRQGRVITKDSQSTTCPLVRVLIPSSARHIEMMGYYSDRDRVAQWMVSNAEWQARQAPMRVATAKTATSSLCTSTRQNMSSIQQNALKRPRATSIVRRTHHLSHIQQLPAATEPAAQDETFIQAQLLRSISTALTIVGYDSVKPSALEMFRAEVEECEDLRLRKRVCAEG
jgi:hypothetical protein